MRPGVNGANNNRLSSMPATFETASSLCTNDVPILPPDLDASSAMRELTGKRYLCATHAVVCEGRQFRGVLRIEELLAASPNASLSALMDVESPVSLGDVDQEVASWRAVRDGRAALCVVDSEGRFVGLIPGDVLLSVLLAEHEEDLTRLGGFTQSTQTARASSEESVERRFRHRIPWLVVGLGGALASAELVGRFEGQLRQKVVLAFFIPGIVYLADAVGTQTETIVVRGLSVGVEIRKMLWPELLAGAAIGLTLAAVTAPVVWWRWGDADLALSVGLSVLAAASTASVTAMLLPWLFSALNRDPAFGSGPLATVIQDLLSIVIYFLVTMAVID